jgi:membrane carboxypeptidase/penicillin-binding protein
VLWEPPVVRVPVLDPEAAWLMVDMMKDVILRGTAYASVYQAGFHIPAAGKTGTTNDGNDVWFIGYTADLVAGVWIGMDLPTKIKANALGGTLAAPAWTAFMTEVYRRKPEPPDWPRPGALIARQIDGTTGLLVSAACPSTTAYVEWFIPGTEPVRDCKGGDVPTASGFPPQPASTPTPAPLPAPVPTPWHPATGVRVHHDSTIANPFKLP